MHSNELSLRYPSRWASQATSAEWQHVAVRQHAMPPTRNTS
eukprot:CAMPEP_0179447874 /NCGR_PEP_ID=MMETSP0799-20121207/31627_1 /TAXON_ID=46947 /ORGANISM="Geminigera cryophila, Strain CCMP2564" /LENGTH=40 /DNA_ID= /DNA_START= /DNA_END= /DNA_ORIENTATION=